MFMQIVTEGAGAEGTRSALVSDPPAPRQAAIVGASGYTGRELQGLLARHRGFRPPRLLTAVPDADGGAARTRGEAGREGAARPIADPFSPGALEGVDAVFLCTPHGAAQELAEVALGRGCAVVDLSADFRLRDPEAYRTSYGAPHRAPVLLDRAVYGLTELRRAEIRGARLIANPGCYPTSILLPLLPVLSAGLADPDGTIVADCKSGASGAGSAPSTRTTFGAIHDNFGAYGVEGHRHLAELEQELGGARIVFVPHLLPVFRGILSTIYVAPARGATADRVREALRARYDGEPFVRILAADEGMPQLADVRTTNRCDIGVAAQGDRIVIVSALDNLLKGAAGQALQNMNLVLGFDEGEGLA